jgi:hypothetical protein
MSQLQCHHVLEPRNFPRLADDSGNLIVLCQACHDEAPDEIGKAYSFTFYESLPPVPRNRLITFLERHAPDQNDLINAIKGGPLFSETAFWNKLTKDKGPNQALHGILQTCGLKKP